MSESIDDYRSRVVEQARNDGHLVLMEHGWHYAIDGHGAMSAEHLRAIADELDSLNEEDGDWMDSDEDVTPEMIADADAGVGDEW